MIGAFTNEWVAFVELAIFWGMVIYFLTYFAFLFAFEDFLKISSSDFKKLRRSALNWGGISDLDRREFRKIVTQYLNKTAMTMDVFQWYKNQS